MTGALFSQLYWKADSRRLSLLAAGAEVNNEYDDFLGTGQTVKTQDNVHTFGFRYLHKFRPGGWFVGVQGISTNYAVGADGMLEVALNQIGLSGFDAAGLGLVFQLDTMDNQRDPSSGHLHTLHNFAYRESLGGEASFDVGYADLRWYRSVRDFGRQKRSLTSRCDTAQGALYRRRTALRLLLCEFAGLYHGELSLSSLLSCLGGCTHTAWEKAWSRGVWRCWLSIW